MKHLLTLLLLLALNAAAQTPPEPPKPPVDPTVPDAALQKLLMATVQNKASEQSMPAILMRGKIINQTGQGLIIIEVNKQILALKQGGTLSLSGEFSHLSLQLTELNKESATIEILPLKQTLRLQ
ncbi:MAG: hypothetical protein IAE77_25020 [Prosthecobacter sp.]|uniref:hypothetical protein n=1 Tax=Prosthecobacter sp. TaxID=1965333 RepID=UPI001A0ED8D5|nr:hypothetical protein [Prosthecobacter sp.]MBE2286743.1 hypothetical protein [Prosthecobacter sp.]